MLTDFEKFLVRFVASYKKPKKIISVIAGGGVSMARLGVIPGSSKALGALWMPYDEDETHVWMEQREVEPQAFAKKTVCQGAAIELYSALTNVYADNNELVAITSALTTNRHRKGDVHAYIAVNHCVYHLKFDKLPEQVYDDPIKPWVDQTIFLKRQAEDEKVAEVALKLLTGFEEESLTNLYADGSLKKVVSDIT